jgi:hypothetical protein
MKEITDGRLIYNRNLNSRGFLFLLEGSYWPNRVKVPIIQTAYNSLFKKTKRNKKRRKQKQKQKQRDIPCQPTLSMTKEPYKYYLLSLSLCFPSLHNLLPYSGVLGRGREVPILPPPGFFFFS